MARVVLFHGAGVPLEVREIPVPQPQNGEILIKVRACLLCGSDLHTHRGRRNEPTPLILGHEISGELVAFGPECTREDLSGAELRLGQRLSWTLAASCSECFFCQDDIPQKCTQLFKYGHARWSLEKPFSGGLADFVLLQPGTGCVIVPETISDELAALSTCATATAAAVLRVSKLRPGERVLVFGAGVLGLMCCAMARALGATAVLVSELDPARREKALTFGATRVVSADALERGSVIHDVTAGRGVDVAVELAGVGETVAAAFESVRIGGRVVLAGTVLPTPSVALDPERVVRYMLTIHGVHNYAPQDLLQAMCFLAGSGRYYPFEDLIRGKYPLSEVEAAFTSAHRQPGARVAVIPSGV